MDMGTHPALRLARGSLIAALAALLALEGLMRVAREGGHARLPIYTAAPRLGLRPGAEAVGHGTGGPYRISIDERGLRAPSPPRGIVLLGDSMAFGLGVEGADSLAARCTERGTPMLNAGVPGFALPDALARAEQFADLADGWLILVNPWDDALPALADRAEVVGGWLLYRDAPGWAKSFFVSGWSHGQLLHEGVVLLGGMRSRAPEGGDFAARGRELLAFADTHPGTRVVWGGYPTEVMPDGRKLEEERRRFGIPVESLVLEEAWLPHDLHWTPAGTEAVAGQLCP